MSPLRVSIALVLIAAVSQTNTYSARKILYNLNCFATISWRPRPSPRRLMTTCSTPFAAAPTWTSSSRPATRPPSPTSPSMPAVYRARMIQPLTRYQPFDSLHRHHHPGVLCRPPRRVLRHFDQRRQEGIHRGRGQPRHPIDLRVVLSRCRQPYH